MKQVLPVSALSAAGPGLFMESTDNTVTVVREEYSRPHPGLVTCAILVEMTSDTGCMFGAFTASSTAIPAAEFDEAKCRDVARRTAMEELHGYLRFASDAGAKGGQVLTAVRQQGAENQRLFNEYLDSPVS